jgi:hypothetical protein
MKNKKNVIAEYEAEVNGQKVTVHKLKPKERKVSNNARSNDTTCPNCLSKLSLNDSGIKFCTGDKLQFWEKEFIKYEKLSDEKKAEYLVNISEDSDFLNLYDRWAYAQKDENKEPFTCGYTNKIFFPIPSSNITIPDPIKVLKVERKLGRKLTEEELYGESDLWEYKGMILKEYRQGSKKVKIPLVRFPEDC